MLALRIPDLPCIAGTEIPKLDIQRWQRRPIHRYQLVGGDALHGLQITGIDRWNEQPQYSQGAPDHPDGVLQGTACES